MVNSVENFDFSSLQLVLCLSYRLLLNLVLSKAFIEFVDQVVDFLDKLFIFDLNVFLGLWLNCVINLLAAAYLISVLLRLMICQSGH